MIRAGHVNSFPGDYSRLEPPDPIPNSEVKQTYADDSVGFPHVKVGHRQVFILKSQFLNWLFFCFEKSENLATGYAVNKSLSAKIFDYLFFLI